MVHTKELDVVWCSLKILHWFREFNFYCFVKHCWKQTPLALHCQSKTHPDTRIVKSCKWTNRYQWWYNLRFCHLLLVSSFPGQRTASSWCVMVSEWKTSSIRWLAQNDSVWKGFSFTHLWSGQSFRCRGLCMCCQEQSRRSHLYCAAGCPG